MNIDTRTIAQRFSHHTIISITPFGNGNINDTYLVCDQVCSFILQRVNPVVFADPQPIFTNQEHLYKILHQKKIAQQALRIPALYSTYDGKSYHRDQEGHYWRAQEFMDNCQEITTLKQSQAQSVGKLLGSFHSLCKPDEARTFINILPNLHATGKHLDKYETSKNQAMPKANKTKLDFCKMCAEHLQEKARVLDRQLRHPTYNKRLIHGDPKLANILFDATTKNAHTLIDLDTIGPGPIHHDLSDLIRSCCNPAGEESQQEEISFELELAKEIIRGYSQSSALFLSRSEINLLGTSLWLIPFELGVRFLNDYFAGSTYFKSTHREQNLNRATSQFKLASQIQQKANLLQQHVDTCFSVQS